ncbi:choice-of-anchor M domain-containing protein [Actinomyces faecalis]|uniref:choice-of-anchor M domain-containing protein n=1 Tax=Actinomyces faecalis TaxID=2722820 RepID=UPI0015552752|nr:choice-of-anchor M domain-containing protein [Actinomyces faecalis]
MTSLRALSRTLASLCAVLALAPGGPAWADPAQEDPDLRQTVSAHEEIVDGPAVLDAGHVDVGPRYVAGTWSVMARDDSGSRPVLRDPDKVALKVTDAALMDAPQGEQYAFMGAKEGERWYVIPQTQDPRVVWLGWNSQDPGVVDLVDRGVTMSLGPVTGPGRSWLFLQSGTFGEPTLLMDGQKNTAQDVWVDANSHVHANWVFTEPGVYTAQLAFRAETRDGQQLSATTTLRFAVGDATSTDEALAAPAPHAPAPHAAETSTSAASDAQDPTTQDAAPSPLDERSRPGLSPVVLWSGLAGLAAVAGVSVLLVRRRRLVAAERAQAQAEIISRESQENREQEL